MTSNKPIPEPNLKPENWWEGNYIQTKELVKLKG